MIMDIGEVQMHDSVCKASKSEKKRVFARCVSDYE